MTADLFGREDTATAEEEPSPKRTYRPVADTLAEVARIQAGNPDMSTAEIARTLGYPPKYLYKLMSANRAGTPAPSGVGQKTAGAARGDALAVKLCDPIAKLATAVAFAAPTVACVLIDRGEATARALVAIAADKPRMLMALENVSKVGPLSDLAETVLCVVIAASLDTGRIPLDHPLAVLTGNTARYARMHPTEVDDRGPAPAPPFPAMPVPGVPVG